jgi:RNA polymerase sigma-70 factor (ECF subfamily)
MLSPPSPEVAPRAPAARVGKGAKLDFASIYRENVRFVWRTAKRMGVEPPMVEDVVQDVFVVVHRRLGEFEGRSSTKTWLYGIVRRIVADHRRAHRRKPAHQGATSTHDLDRVTDASDAGCASPHANAEKAEQRLLLHRVLACLDEDKREVFLLSEFEGMTMAEISEALDVNPNTVSSRLRAARSDFQQALDELTRGDGAQPSAAEGRRAR